MYVIMFMGLLAQAQIGHNNNIIIYIYIEQTSIWTYLVPL